MITVYNLDTGKRLLFFAKTPLEAMNSLLYYLNLSHADREAKIDLLGRGRTLSLLHHGETWSVPNR